MRGKESGAKILQAALEIRTAIEAFPLIPAVKWLLADMQKEDGWRRVHPPLTGLSEADWRGLRDRLATMGFFDQHEGL